ncbi:MAG: methyltransferase domain-containing protein [Candidatus Aminicenantes bacterium]
MSYNTVLDREIEVAAIITKYKKINIDVSPYFHNLNKIQIYRCLDSGYRFYYPFNIGGDNAFYEKLQERELYYLPWKWEHQVASKYIKPGMRVLEVGCARGDFINKLSRKGAICTGLEFNKKAIMKGQDKGVKILEESIQEHAENYTNFYDIVCSFQVMEHIPVVRSFIESKLKVLKKGGKLIISVPNNDSTLDFENSLLNLPPHHLGLWNRESLLSIEMIYKLKLIDLKFEPLQDYHFKWYKRSFEKKINSHDNFLKYKILKSLYFNLRLDKLYYKYIKYLSKIIRGHSIIITYSK